MSRSRRPSKRRRYCICWYCSPAGNKAKLVALRERIELREALR